MDEVCRAILSKSMSNQHRMIARVYHLFSCAVSGEGCRQSFCAHFTCGIQRVVLSSSMVLLWRRQRRWCERLATSTRPVEQLQETV